MKFGYGRVSTRDQHPEAQRDALAVAGCEQIFLDTVSGKLARRPELDKALLSANRAGDQLIVTKLDRLGRSLEHLIELANLLQAQTPLRPPSLFARLERCYELQADRPRTRKSS